MEQLVILLIIGGISLAKWLIEKSAELRENKRTQERLDRLDETELPEPREPHTAPDETVRKFLEALGLPPEATAPAPPPLPPTIAQPLPPLRHAEVQPPPRVVPAADLERRLLETKKLASSFARRNAGRDSVSQTAPGSAVRLDQLLRTREGLRQAVLAREILGPPKALDF